VSGEFAYNFRYVCPCGHELETDDAHEYTRFEIRHREHKSEENEALTLLTRLVTAAESIVDHCKADLEGGIG
jgi:hypothetical protein